jgi:transposase InsO family protein
MGVLTALALFVRSWFIPRANLVCENLALRQQLSVYKHRNKRPKLRPRHRVFWTWLMHFWPDWRSALVIVKPETVIRWHRQGFRLYWRWNSTGCRPGRPMIEPELRALIRRMSKDNPTWGAPRIQSELKLLGHDIAESTVAKYMVRHRKPPSQTWRTFLDNHAPDLIGIDFFTVPTATFRVLYCFVVLRHDRRRVAHFNVTANPTAQWTAQQIVDAFPFDEAPRSMIRDRDDIYGDAFRKRVKNMGIEEVVIAARSPWQNPYCERMIGSIRRECLDHVMIVSETHLQRILACYFDYYHGCRTHLSLDRNSPTPRDVEPASQRDVIAIPKVGGLHHRYTRAA